MMFMFMAVLLGFLSSCPALCRASTFLLAQPRTWMAGTYVRRRASRFCPAMTQQLSLNPRHIEFRLLAAAVAAQRAFLADRVRALEDPVLPRGQAREDFRFHRLGSDEAQARFHAGEAVGRKAGALFQEHADLVVPVDVVEREGDEAELFGLLGVERGAHCGFGTLHVGRIGLEARRKPRQAVAH